MENLPNEVLTEILLYLDGRVLREKRLVSKKWNSLICHPDLNHRLPIVKLYLGIREDWACPRNFLQGMSGSIVGQDFPFTKFRFESSHFVSRTVEDLQKVSDAVSLFADKYGRFIKQLILPWVTDFPDENFTRARIQWFFELLNKSPNVQSLNIFQFTVEEDDKLEEFKPAAPLLNLTHLKIRINKSTLRLLNSLFLASVCPNLKKFELTFNIPEDAGVLQKLQELSNRTVPVFNLKVFLTGRRDISFFQQLQDLQLRVHKLKISTGCCFEEDLKATSDWLASLSPTLQDLKLKMLTQRGEDFELQIPHTENLRTLKIIPARQVQGTPDSVYYSSPSGDFANLTTLRFGHGIGPGRLFQKLFRAQNDLRIPNLEELELWDVEVDDMDFILTQFTQLRRLGLKIPTGFQFISIPSEDTWLIGGAQGAVPCFGNLRSLSSLKILMDWRPWWALKVLKGLAYLSSAEKLRPLSSLVLGNLPRDAVAQGQRYLDFLRQHHLEVRLTY